MDDSHTVKAAIAALGGIKATASIAGVTYHAAYGWNRASRRFPADTYVTLAPALAVRGFFAPMDLWAWKFPKQAPVSEAAE